MENLKFEIEKCFLLVEEFCTAFDVLKDFEDDVEKYEQPIINGQWFEPTERELSVGDCSDKLLCYLRATDDVELLKRCSELKCDCLKWKLFGENGFEDDKEIYPMEYVQCYNNLSKIRKLWQCRQQATQQTESMNDTTKSDEPRQFVLPWYLQTPGAEKALKLLETLTGYAGKKVLSMETIPWKVSSLSEWGYFARWFTDNRKLDVPTVRITNELKNVDWDMWGALIGTSGKKLKNAYYSARKKSKDTPPLHIKLETELNKHKHLI